MIILDWMPIKMTERIPPFGKAVQQHLENYKGTVKYASCSVWGLLFRVLEDNGVIFGEVSFEKNGKPFFEDCPIHFSLSHSGGICAVAVSDRPIGVDVEQQKENYNSHLIERSLSETEKGSFDGDFARIWCRKEAVAKMTGIGITGYPNDIDTTAYQFQEQRMEFEGKSYWIVAVNQGVNLI